MYLKKWPYFSFQSDCREEKRIQNRSIGTSKKPYYSEIFNSLTSIFICDIKQGTDGVISLLGSTEITNKPMNKTKMGGIVTTDTVDCMTPHQQNTNLWTSFIGCIQGVRHWTVQIWRNKWQEGSSKRWVIWGYHKWKNQSLG